MVPREYRLDVVASRLASRLDGSRRSLPDPARRHDAFTQRTEAFVAQVANNWRVVSKELDLDADPATHARFLREELLQTFLPRFEEAVERVGREEISGYGLGDLSRPVGRLGLAVAGVVGAWMSLRLGGPTYGVPFAMMLLAMPGLPELLRMLALRRYRRDVEEILADLGRIQDSAGHDGALRPLQETLGELDTHDEEVRSQESDARALSDAARRDHADKASARGDTP